MIAVLAGNLIIFVCCGGVGNGLINYYDGVLLFFLLLLLFAGELVGWQ